MDVDVFHSGEAVSVSACCATGAAVLESNVFLCFRCMRKTQPPLFLISSSYFFLLLFFLKKNF